MDTSLTNHIKELKKLTYKDQCAYIAKKLISMRPDDITHFTFLKKLQAMLINLPDAFNDFMKVMKEHLTLVLTVIYLTIFFFYSIEAHIIIYCKRVSQDEYLVKISIKNNLEDIITIIKIK